MVKEQINRGLGLQVILLKFPRNIQCPVPALRNYIKIIVAGAARNDGDFNKFKYVHEVPSCEALLISRIRLVSGINTINLFRDKIQRDRPLIEKLDPRSLPIKVKTQRYEE